MAWSDAARAAAAEVRRRHAKVTHGLTTAARGRASGPGDSLLQALRDQHFRTRVAAIKAKEYNTPKQWGKSPGWMARQFEGTKKMYAAQKVAARMGKVVRRYSRLVG